MLDYRLNESSPVQMQQQAVDTETQGQARIEQAPNRKGVTLRRRLLTTVLPVVLAPLAIAGGLSWYLTHQRSNQQAELRLWNEALLTSGVFNDLLKDAFKVPTVLANDPLIINTARTSGTQAEAAGLHQLPIEQVEKRFVATKLLQPNQALNNYLSRDAKIGNLAELFFTDRNGFNIASTNPTSDFVQRDEKWWQEGKNKGQALGQPEFDESSKTTALDLMSAIKDPASGKFLGVIKGVFSVTNLEELESLLEHLGASGSEQIQVLSVREGGAIINTLTAVGSSDTQEVIGGKAVLQKATALIAELKSQNVNFDTKEGRSTSYISNAEQLRGLNITPWTHETGDRALITLFTHNGRRYAMATTPDTDWVAIASVDLSDIAAAGNELGLTFILIFLVLAAVAALIISYLARQLSAPLGKLVGATEQFTSGNLNSYAQPSGTRETQALAQNFNNLVTWVKTLLAEQEKSARQQLVIQEAAAHQQAENAEQQRLAKEQLQKRALELLVQVDPVSRGDLTIRADVTEDEIGTIADSYNATIASLRKIVIQVQGAAGQMATTTSSSEVSVQGLSQEALRQTKEITAALDRIGEMSKSIRAVAMSAELAEAAVKEANQTVEAGDAAMNRTVDGILAIRETVAETATKVKQLGDSSQKISKVVNLIGTFAAQTNLLALKASIEAARAGEEGRGFAVLADEVRILARQSAQATSEIESLVTGIQAETNEVVAVMEAGTQRVVTGTKLVDETRQSLNKITAVSGQIGSLVEAIASAAMVQTQTSEDVTQSMSDVAAIARQTSNEASSVSASFKELLAVAQHLQVSAGQFKVN